MSEEKLLGGPGKETKAFADETAETGVPLHLPRVMGFSDLLMFYIVTGISLLWIATAAAAGPSAIVIWIGAWFCFYTPLALSVIELSSRYPQEGGLYVWSKRAFGDFSGYMSGWTYWTSNLPYFPAVLYFAASNLLFVRGVEGGDHSASRAYYMWFSIVALFLITFLNVIGLSFGKWLHNIGAFGMWVPVAIIVVMSLYAWRHFGSPTSFAMANLIPSTHLKDIFFWATLTFAFGGCETGSFIAGEVKNSRKTIPRALLVAGLLVTFSYIVGTVCVLLAMPSNEVSDLQGLMQAISRTACRLGWYGVIPVAAILIALSNIGASGGYLSSVARLPFVAGLDQFLPASFAKLHPRWGTPYVSLIGPRFLLLQPEHRREQVQIRNEVCDDSHTHQHIICALDAGACLRQKHEQNSGKHLHNTGRDGNGPNGFLPWICDDARNDCSFSVSIAR